MDNNNLNPEIKENNPTGILHIAKKNIFFILFVVIVIGVFIVVLYLNSVTPGGFSPFKKESQKTSLPTQNNVNTAKNNEPVLDSVPDQHITVKGIYTKSTNKITFESTDIKGAPYFPTQSSTEVSSNPLDLNTNSWVKIGVISLNNIQNEYFIKDTGADKVPFTLNFPMRYIFGIYVADNKNKILSQELLEI